MTRYHIRVHRFQGRFLIVPVLENPIIEARRYQFQTDLIWSFVFPEPTMDTGARRRERAMRVVLADLIIEFVAVVVILVRFLIGFSMKFEAKLSRRQAPPHRRVKTRDRPRLPQRDHTLNKERVSRSC